MNSGFNKLFSELRLALINNKGRYYDENVRDTFSLNNIVLCCTDNELWVSAHDIKSIYFKFRPLVICEDGNVCLLDVSTSFEEEFKCLSSSGRTSNGKYERINWVTLSYDQFIDEKYTLKFTDEAIFHKYLEYRQEWIQKLNIIAPVNGSNILDEQFVPLYDRLIKATGGQSHWINHLFHIYLDIKLTIINGELSYYISRIYGDEGENYDYQKINPYDIVINNNSFNVVKGNINSLNIALDRLERQCYTSHRLLQYKKPETFEASNTINDWIIEGCPDNFYLKYELFVTTNGEILGHPIITFDS